MNFNEYLYYLINNLKNVNSSEIEELINILTDAYKNEKSIFIIGNGGSAANASHFAQDLAKGTLSDLSKMQRIKALSLTDNVSFITALANDEGYDRIFEQQLITFAKSNDILIAISGSGNSTNVIRAIEWANSNGLETFGVTGFNGGKVKTLCKYNIHVSLNDMCTVETIHSFIFHYAVISLKNRI